MSAELVVFPLFLLIAYGLGRKLLNALRFSPENLAEDIVFSFGTGYGTLALATFFIGLAQFLHLWVFAVLFAVAGIASHAEIILLLKQLLETARRARVRCRLHSLLIVYLAVLSIAYLVASRSPPFGWDAMVYHLAIPKIYIAQHGITYLPSLSMSNFPMAVNMLYLLGLLFSGGILAQMIAFSFAFLLAIAAYAFGTRFYGKNVGALAAAFIYTTPLFIQYSTEPWVDIPLAFFVFLALYAIIVWLQLQKWAWLAVAGAMTGLAIGTKHIGAFAAVALGIVLGAGMLVQRVKFASIIKYGLLFGLVVLVIAAPWFVRSFAFTGNPVYPFYYDVFGGRDWNEVSNQKLMDDPHDRYHYSGFLNFFLLPWATVMQSTEFNALLGFSPVFLAFGTLYLFVKKEKNANYLLLFALVFSVLWYTQATLALRYYIVYPMLAVVSAYTFGTLLKRNLLGYLLLALVATSLLFAGALWYGVNGKKIPHALGLEIEDAFYERLVDYNPYAAGRFAEENIPKDARLLLFTEQRGYYFEQAYDWGQPLSQGYLTYYDLADEHALYDELRGKGITHVVYNTNAGLFLRENNVDNRTAQLMDAVVARYGSAVYNESSIILYALG